MLSILGGKSEEEKVIGAKKLLWRSRLYPSLDVYRRFLKIHCGEIPSVFTQVSFDDKTRYGRFFKKYIYINVSYVEDESANLRNI